VNPETYKRAKRGVAFGVTAYGLWGLFPLYFNRLRDIVSWQEQLAQRAFWSFVVLAVFVLLFRLRALVRDVNKKNCLLLALSGLLLTINWGGFLYAISSGQVLQSSLGYFMAPLANVALGVIFFRDPLGPRRWLSIALAVTGVTIWALVVGRPPWIALTLATSFSLYGLIRKTVKVDGFVGLAMEMGWVAPFSGGYLAHCWYTGTLTPVSPSIQALFIGSGIITPAPLVFFAAAARRLKLSTLGMLQYITPSCQFLVAVLVFDETFEMYKLISFLFIWSAVAVYVWESMHTVRVAKQEAESVLTPD
jgi:chloramphenicol-sensitive protein RarD